MSFNRTPDNTYLRPDMTPEGASIGGKYEFDHVTFQRKLSLVDSFSPHPLEKMSSHPDLTNLEGIMQQQQKHASQSESAQLHINTSNYDNVTESPKLATFELFYDEDEDVISQKVTNVQKEKYFFHKEGRSNNSFYERHSHQDLYSKNNEKSKSSSESMIKVSSNVQKPKSIGLYNIIKTIGSGNFSVVKLAEHRYTQTKVAIKIIDKQVLSADNLKKVYKEVEIMKTLHHPHIVKLFQVITTENMLYIVMEYVPNGEMFEHIVKNERLSEVEAQEKFKQILSAVQYCHDNNVVHRDLKAENLLLDQHMVIKLADFGFGSFFNSGELMGTFCGSPPYAAPEIFKGEKYIGPKADIWSLGVVLYVMVCGALPFDEQTLPRLRDQVLSGIFRIPFWMSDDCEDLIRSMLRLNPERRSSLISIKKHKWLQSIVRIDDNSLIYPHVQDNSIAEQMKSGDYNDIVIHIMEKNGLNRNQIVESLNNRAYDNLTAMYLLLGDKLKQHRQSFPITPPPTVLAAGSISDQIQVKMCQMSLDTTSESRPQEQVKLSANSFSLPHSIQTTCYHPTSSSVLCGSPFSSDEHRNSVESEASFGTTGSSGFLPSGTGSFMSSSSSKRDILRQSIDEGVETDFSLVDDVVDSFLLQEKMFDRDGDVLSTSGPPDGGSYPHRRHTVTGQGPFSCPSSECDANGTLGFSHYQHPLQNAVPNPSIMYYYPPDPNLNRQDTLNSIATFDSSSSMAPNAMLPLLKFSNASDTSGSSASSCCSAVMVPTATAADSMTRLNVNLLVGSSGNHLELPQSPGQFRDGRRASDGMSARKCVEQFHNRGLHARAGGLTQIEQISGDTTAKQCSPSSMCTPARTIHHPHNHPNHPYIQHKRLSLPDGGQASGNQQLDYLQRQRQYRHLMLLRKHLLPPEKRVLPAHAAMAPAFHHVLPPCSGTRRLSLGIAGQAPPLSGGGLPGAMPLCTIPSIEHPTEPAASMTTRSNTNEVTQPLAGFSRNNNSTFVFSRSDDSEHEMDIG